MYAEYQPPPWVARWVECLWSIETRQDLRSYPVRPDGCMDILFTPGEGVAVVGAMTTEKRFDLPSGSRRTGVRFRPGMARRFLHIDAAEAVDRVIPLADVLGRHARELHERLEETDSSSKCCAILVETLSRPSEAPGPVELAIEAMTRAHGDIELGWIADQAGMSERQFRRRCLAESGLAPKHLARVLRFRRACRLATQGASWLTIAAESGYFDQAHLIRDFREFTGATPVSVFSKTSPAAVG